MWMNKQTKVSKDISVHESTWNNLRWGLTMTSANDRIALHVEILNQLIFSQKKQSQKWEPSHSTLVNAVLCLKGLKHQFFSLLCRHFVHYRCEFWLLSMRSCVLYGTSDNLTLRTADLEDFWKIRRNDLYKAIKRKSNFFGAFIVLKRVEQNNFTGLYNIFFYY